MTSQQNQFNKTAVDFSAPALNWAVFISGHGSNLQAMIDAHPAINIRLVVSNKAEAQGVARAERAGIPTLILPQDIDWSEVTSSLRAQQVDRIFLAGFMKIIPADFIRDWTEKMLNLHPSLLPNYKGLRAIERSYEDGAAMGVTIHWVTADLDAGPILLQREVFEAGVAKRMDLSTVKTKIHQVENEMVVEAVRRCQGC